MDALQLAGALALVALSLVGLVIGVRDERRRHRAEVWSRHGTPRTVSIRYPRGGWSGQAPWSIALYLLWTGIVSAFLLFLVVNIAAPGPWTTAGRIALAAGAVGGLGGGVLALLSYLGTRTVDAPGVRTYGYVPCGIPATEPRLHCVLVHEAPAGEDAGRLTALPRDTAHVRLPGRAVAIQVRYDGLTRFDLAQQLAGQARRAARRG